VFPTSHLLHFRVHTRVLLTLLVAVLTLALARPAGATAAEVRHLAHDGTRLERWFESAEFRSLQGMLLAADGRNLPVADCSRGLWRIAPANKFCFIADSGRSLYEKPRAAAAPRPVHILSVPL
jgi:hypothetical protein